jgi:hypothetical protein
MSKQELIQKIEQMSGLCKELSKEGVYSLNCSVPDYKFRMQCDLSLLKRIAGDTPLKIVRRKTCRDYPTEAYIEISGVRVFSLLEIAIEEESDQ